MRKSLVNFTSQFRRATSVHNISNRSVTQVLYKSRNTSFSRPLIGSTLRFSSKIEEEEKVGQPDKSSEESIPEGENVEGAKVESPESAPKSEGSNQFSV